MRRTRTQKREVCIYERHHRGQPWLCSSFHASYTKSKHTEMKPSRDRSSYSFESTNSGASVVACFYTITRDACISHESAVARACLLQGQRPPNAPRKQQKTPKGLGFCHPCGRPSWNPGLLASARYLGGGGEGEPVAGWKSVLSLCLCKKSINFNPVLVYNFKTYNFFFFLLN